MTDLNQQFLAIKHRMADAAKQHQRDVDDITLLAVSKKKPAPMIEDLYHLGQRSFGENYLQEARDKQQALSSLDIEWHFIGPIQSNKTRDIAENFAWVHSVDRLKIAKRLSQQRPEHLPPLNICIQVNIEQETTKAGISLDALPELIASISELPRIKLRGLMSIPAQKDSAAEQRTTFARLAHAKQTHSAIAPLDTLSMGMSGDMEAAIAEGATIIRVGSALFGARV